MPSFKFTAGSSIQFVSESDLDDAIRKLADAAGETVKDVLPAQMRLFAGDLAFNTRPIGKSAASQKEGQRKIAIRINSIYLSVGGAVNILKKEDKNIGSAFSALIQKRKYTEAQALFSKHAGTSARFTVGQFDGGALHKKQAFVKRVTERMIVVDFKKVERYTKQIHKLVGFAKGGYATGARQLGGVRGIPGFATRQKSPGTGKVTGDGKTLTVTLTNDVRYIENALDYHGEMRATDHRRRSVDLVLKRMADRKFKRASKSLK